MQGLQDWKIRGLQAVVLANVLDEGRPRERPLIRTYGKEEGWKAVLADGINQVEVLPLPVSSRKGFLLKTAVRITARCLGRIQ